MHENLLAATPSTSFINAIRLKSDSDALLDYRGKTSPYSMQRAFGNKKIANNSQATPALVQPANKLERQADRVADRIVSGSLNPGEGDQADILRKSGQKTQAQEIQARSKPSGNNGQPSRINLPGGSGKPLADPVRSLFESKFGHDFDKVRIHNNDEAAESAESINANAYTVGNDIVFNTGQYAPSTRQGQHLLAHELMHTVQQDGPTSASRDGMLQRDEKASQAKQTVITVADVFPFPKGSQVVLGRIMNDKFFKIISKSDKPLQQQMAAALTAIHGLNATVTTATPDNFVATANSVVTLPAQGKSPARKLTDLTLTQQRSGNEFTFSVSAKEGKSKTPTPLMPSQAGLTAIRDKEGGIILSSTIKGKTVPQLRVSQEGDSSMIEAYTKSISPLLSMLVPKIDVISVNKLPEAKKQIEVQKAEEKILSRQASRRKTRRQQASLGFGGAKIDDAGAFLLRTSWMIRFPTTSIASLITDNKQIATGVGEVVNIPLEVQILYTPPSSVLGSLSSGLGFRMPTSVPVNLSLLGGIGGGTMQFPTAQGPRRRDVLGPTMGGALGVEFGRWQVDVRADHLWNVIKDSEGESSGISTFSGNLGVGF